MPQRQNPIITYSIITQNSIVKYGIYNFLFQSLLQDYREGFFPLISFILQGSVKKIYDGLNNRLGMNL